MDLKPNSNAPEQMSQVSLQSTRYKKTVLKEAKWFGGRLAQVELMPTYHIKLLL